MDLEELRALASLAQTHSLLKTADALGVSRTTLRRRLEALEARVGVPLFNRDRRGARLTPAGELLAARGRGIVHEATSLLATVREAGREPTGELRVALPVGAPPQVLTLLFSVLRARFPQLRYHVRMESDPLRGLLDEVDVAVHLGIDDPPGPWVARTILQVREWAVASRRYLERHKPIRTIEDFAHHTLFSWAGPSVDPLHWPTTRGTWFPVQPVVTSPDIHWLRQCALAGHGIALIPDARLPDPGVPPGTLVPVLPELVGRDRHVRLMVPAAMAELPRIRALLGAVDQWVATLAAATRSAPG